MVSIIMTARERYGLTQPSLLSLLKGLEPSVEVLVVAGKAPADVLVFLEKISRSVKNFTLIRIDRYLWPNEARLLGLARASKNNDVVFTENDLLFRRGWLKNLLRCFREQKADIVAPLIFEGDFKDKNPISHDAGAIFIRKGPGKEGPLTGLDHFYPHTWVDSKLLKASQVDMVESHCFLIRRQLLRKLALKKKHGNIFAHLDLCLQAEKWGAKVMVEPKSQVVFANPYMSRLQTREDFEFFLYQWSEKENQKRIQEMARDWGMNPWRRPLRDYRVWVLWNKDRVFSSFGVLTVFERLLGRIARMIFFPSGARVVLERFLTARIRAGVEWNDASE